MVVRKRYFLTLLTAWAMCSFVHAQSDTLRLSNGRVLVGSYKVSHTLQEVEHKTKFNEVYRAKDVLSLSTAKRHYLSTDIRTKGETSHYLVERLVDSEVDLYGIDFPSGYFNTNSVAQSFFYFEKNGVLTYVNKGDIEGFYTSYFGDCYGWIPDKKLQYNEGSVTKMLNAYNKCLNPNAEEKVVEPALTGLCLTAFGGIGRQSHYPLNTAFNGGRFKDVSNHFGLGLNFVIQHKFVIGLEASHTQHSMSSPIFLVSLNDNSPIQLNANFNSYCFQLSGAFNLRFNKLTILPGASVGVGKIYGYSDKQVQQNIFINFTPYTINPLAEAIFTFEEPFYNLYAFTTIGYDIGNKLGLFARGGFDLILTKSLAGEKSKGNKQGNHAIDGLLLSFGVAYKIKN